MHKCNSAKLFFCALMALTSLYTNFSFAASQVNDERFVGSNTCSNCHRQEFDQWQGSHHDLAMQHANASSVLGDFSGSTFSDNGITSSFFKKGEEFWVNTDGPDGDLADYKISFALGVDPLQQYLIAFDDGRLQTLSIAWDSRSKENGGQRWFHLYANKQVHSGDVLHWTRASQTWNLQCAACHSTNLKKNYDRESDSYQTSWYEMNVACEACHGAGTDHINWVTQSGSQESPNLESKAAHAFKGFDKQLSPLSKWLFEEGKATATNHLITKNSDQIQACVGCHSRRSAISEQAGEDFLDQYIPALLEPGLYHPDGQILDEVYVYGSFTQSKMHGQGVTCSNCHTPHTLELKAPGNQVCAQCHLPGVFDSEEHHQHSVADSSTSPSISSGSLCVNCHMPETTYMTVDPRRDHSIRIPRPEISKQFGTPNACNQCHTEESIDWAIEQYKNWYGDDFSAKPTAKLSSRHPVHAFDAATHAPEESTHRLQNIAFNNEQALMIRASAVSRMSANPSQDSIGSAIKLLESEDALVRFSAANLMEALPLEQRKGLLWPLLQDPIKAVRIAAARLLADLTPAYLDSEAEGATPESIRTFITAIDEYEAALKLNEDIPGGVSQLGQLYLAMGNLNKAENAYSHALKLEPLFIPARLNLADIYRARNQESRVLGVLQAGLTLIPNQADFSFALGLSFVRQRNSSKAMPLLRTAAEEAPDNARYAYVYAVALFDSGEQNKAISSLKASLEQHPGNRDILSALVSYLNGIGQRQEAMKYSAQL